MRVERRELLTQVFLEAKTFSSRRILQDVRLSIIGGECLGLFGPSGCGKTTLLRIIAGLDDDFEGEVVFRRDLPTVFDSLVGMVFQDTRLFPWMTVEGNIRFAMGRPSRDSHDRVAELLHIVGLAPSARRAWPSALSGGMRKRVSVARALAARPSLLLLDEPLNELDVPTRHTLQAMLVDVQTRTTAAVLLVSHDVDELVYVADRIIVLSASQPSTVVCEVPVDLPRPRNRKDPQYLALCNLMMEALVRSTPGE